MRTLTPTLLEAQRSLRGVPSVSLRVQDRELRWAPLLDDDASAQLTAGCAVAGGLLRARIGAAGTLDLQRITDPGEPAQWQAWTTLAGGVALASDVAISAVDGEPAKIRLFFVRTGGDPYRLSWMQSADAGATWSEPADLSAALPVADRGLAGANGQLFYHDPADDLLKLAAREGWEAGGWTLSSWTAGGALATRYGLAAGFLAGVYHVASCDQEGAGVCRLRTGTYSPASAWSDPVAIVPPGLPAAAFIPLYPSLIYAEGAWHLAYLETIGGPLSYAQPAIIHSSDWEHWSYSCWVPLTGTGGPRRAVLLNAEGLYYLALECGVWQAASYNPADGGRNLLTGDLLGYVVEEEPWYGRALVEVHNPGGRYDRFGQAGYPGAAVRPLARLVLERGFRTPAGDERVDRVPYYLVSAAVRRGGARPALRLEAEDGWGLLRRWRPDALYAWSGKTVAWLIAEVLCRAAGLACSFDGGMGWDNVLESFAIGPTGWDGAAADARHAPSEALRGTGLGALRTLLAKVGGQARWQADGSLYCFIPFAQALTDPYVAGSRGEILDALYGRSLVAPTEARVFGDGVAALASALGSLCERRYVATCVDPHLTTTLACANRAAALADAGAAGACLGWVETPCLCGLDLYDLLAVEDARAGALDAAWLRVTGIVERYNPREGVFVTRAAFEGA